VLLEIPENARSAYALRFSLSLRRLRVALGSIHLFHTWLNEKPKD